MIQRSVDVRRDEDLGAAVDGGRPHGLLRRPPRRRRRRHHRHGTLRQGRRQVGKQKSDDIIFTGNIRRHTKKTATATSTVGIYSILTY